MRRLFIESSGWQPMGRGPTVGLLAMFRGLQAIRLYKIFVDVMLAADKMLAHSNNGKKLFL